MILESKSVGVSEETVKKFSYIYDTVYRCILYASYFEIISSEGPDSQFWNAVQNTMGDEACLYWFHLFGNRDDELYYKKFLRIDDVSRLGCDYKEEKIKAGLLNSAGFNDDQQFEIFWKNTKACRDKFLAHKEFKSEFNYPDLPKIRKMAEYFIGVLGDIVKDWMKDIGLDYNPCWKIDKEVDLDSVVASLYYYLESSNRKIYNICLDNYINRDFSMK